MEEKLSEAEPHVTTVADTLASEISAVEIYQQALDAVGEDPAVSEELNRLLADHEWAARELDRFQHGEGDPAVPDSGVGGFGEKATQAVAKILGKRMILLTLKEGEARAQLRYDNLVRQVVGPGQRHPSLAAFASQRSVAVQQNIDTLERLLTAA
jgi:hypothetical protein